MPGELTPVEQLGVIRKRVLTLVEEQTRCLRDEVLPELASHGIVIAPYATLSEEEKQSLSQYFIKNIFLVLTPQAVDPARPFPYISNLSLNIGLTVESNPEDTLAGAPLGNEMRFVRIKVPPVVPRLIPVNKEGTKFALVEEVIEANIQSLFPSMTFSKGHLFRVTRDADVEIRDDKAADLLALIKESLRERRFGLAVRLEVSSSMPPEMVEYLTNSLKLEKDDVYVIDGLLDVQDLMELYSLDQPDLKDKPLKAIVPPALRNKESLFDAIKKQDILLHHPYSAFVTIVDFIDAAAQDPQVVAIKMCLYRTGKKSPIPQALIQASERGKQVTAVVEIKARFDEEHNIEWAKRLAESGVHVVYGLVGLKTHSKVALVVRREEDGLQTYTHIATGNYNPTTSRVYTDLGLLTSDSMIGDDATDLFNFLTGFSMQKEFSRLMVAPLNLRRRMMKLIKRETEHALAGRPAYIAAKVNRLTDLPIIVRGACMIRPGEPGLSQTIHVRSIVGRFLEHSRIFYFANGGEEEVYIGSADWMARNLDRRVEVVVPVLDPQSQSYLKDTVIAAYLRDNVKARVMNSDGSYECPAMEPGEEPFNSQLFFEGPNSSPAVGNVHSLKSKRMWSRK
jgi:polyphosphate kinase